MWPFQNLKGPKNRVAANIVDKMQAKRGSPTLTPVLPTLLDILSPIALDFKRDRLLFGELEGRVLIVTDLPNKVGRSWLAHLFSMPGVTGSMHVIPTDAADLIQRINSSISEFSARLASGSRNAIFLQRTEQSIKDAQELLRKIDQEQQRVFSVIIVLLVLADNPSELDKRSRRVEAAAAAAGLRVRSAVFLQQEGLTATGPWALLPNQLATVAPRAMPSETIAAAFPFIGSGVNHGSGIVLGRDKDGGLVLINRWEPPQNLGITNPNMTVLATSGAGKSFAVKLMLLREFMLGTKVFVLDPEREYRELCLGLRGSWINAAGGTGRINPLQIHASPLDVEEQEPASNDWEQGHNVSALAQHLQRLRTFFALYLRELTDVERASLEEATIAVYQSAGISWMTAPETVSTWPTLTDVYTYIKARSEQDPDRWLRLEILLRPVAHGSDAPLWAGQSSVTRDADFVVLDVHDLQHSEDRTKRAQFFNVLTYAWDMIRRDRSERKMLVVDEAWMLADPQVPQALNFLRDMAKRIRKYSGSLTIISQNTVDFLAPEVARQGEAVLGNASIKFLLRQGERDLEIMPRLLSLSEAEMNLLKDARRGEGLLVAGNQRVHVRIEAAPHELALIDPASAPPLPNPRGGTA